MVKGQEINHLKNFSVLLALEMKFKHSASISVSMEFMNGGLCSF